MPLLNEVYYHENQIQLFLGLNGNKSYSIYIIYVCAMSCNIFIIKGYRFILSYIQQQSKYLSK